MKNGMTWLRNTISSKQTDENNTTLANGKNTPKKIEDKKKLIFQSNPSNDIQNVHIEKKVKFNIPVPTPNIQVPSENNNSKDKQVLIQDTEAQKMLNNLGITNENQLDFKSATVLTAQEKKTLAQDTQAQKMLEELEISDPTQLNFQPSVGIKSQLKNEIESKKNILIKLENAYINNSLQHIERFEKYNIENFKLIADKILDFEEKDLSLEEINKFHNEYKELKDKIPKDMQTSLDFNIQLIIDLKNQIKKPQVN